MTSTDTATRPTGLRRVFLDRFEQEEQPQNAYTAAALERHKFEGLRMAVKARWFALAVVGIMLPFLYPNWDVLYYEAGLLLFAGIGWAMWHAGEVGQSKAELGLILCDLVLMTLVMLVPNPFVDFDLTQADIYRFQNFSYFYIFLAAGTLAYSWRTLFAFGTWTFGLWMAGLAVSWWVFEPNLALGEQMRALLSDDRVFQLYDPNSLQVPVRIQEVVVFGLVALILGISMRRFNGLLYSNAALERERANLSRYFSPNVVDELSNNDEPLKQIRTQDVAVMFVDIVGFTEYAAARPPEAVIDTLRGFHGRMEAQVFEHNGTLDKYLGDGLMATFGTPVAGERDASNAFTCAQDMLEEVQRWNVERRAAGEPDIEIGIGLHYGQAVLGDIGANRLEFAVIGNTVNVASRLEAMTRPLGVPLVISDAMHDRILAEGGTVPATMTRHDGQVVRGIEEELTVWTP